LILHLLCETEIKFLENLWIIYVLVFGAALFGVQAIYWIGFRARQQQKTINRRLVLKRDLSNSAEVLETLRRERGFADFTNPTLAKISDFLVQTGLKIEPNALVLYVIGLSAIALILFSVILGFTLSAVLWAAIVSPVMVFLFLRRARRRRIARFSQQLPDALDIIVRGVKVGHPLSTALNLVAKEMADPIGTEFGMTTDEVAFGLDLNTAIENLCRRVGQEDLLFFMTAISVQSQTGGNLAEILERLSQLIRQREKIRLKINALTAEGRLSAIVLSLVPCVIFGAVTLIAPSYYGEVRNHPATIPTLAFALLLLAVGNVIIRRMVNFKA
jgi:tight adherence protein B